MYLNLGPHFSNINKNKSPKRKRWMLPLQSQGEDHQPVPDCADHLHHHQPALHGG